MNVQPHQERCLPDNQNVTTEGVDNLKNALQVLESRLFSLAIK
jgi:hypothetical protein